MDDPEDRADAHRILIGSTKEFAHLPGSDLLARVDPFYAWQQSRREMSLWSYGKVSYSAPRAECSVRYDDGTAFAGVNLATQDYLGLSSHPAILDAARRAMYAHGVHSGGSGVLLGRTRFGTDLEAALCDYLHMEHAVLFPTGWGAGFGAIQGLVREDDHIVIDERAHACLQQGAHAATRRVHRVRHLDTAAFERTLTAIRAGDTRNAILVVTESLFSMDSDTPDIAALQALCDDYKATLLVDVAHDIGAVGVDGRGFVGKQGMLGRVDLLIGSFSKTFASNGGFVLTHSRAVKEYLMVFASTHIFSNALSPVQAAVVGAALDIVRSPAGAAMRHALAARATQLRAALSAAGLTCLGDRSPIVPVAFADEALARLTTRALPARGVVANLVEYPGVPRGTARLRLQLMAAHSPRQIRQAAEGIGAAYRGAIVERVAYPSIGGDTSC
ncbi:glycine C-acetyltransferase [Luteibacter sp. UNCMF331Sha3.1]|uniref:aminotransferase class I/II-fold pyridoxal phosphate-dependent enzyme n=1 Tax=Luteibacter sp. UNCMF331Sha3.1 TaxID=1502760 RepID=UPI0008D2A7DC|nr:pyridoxal phosphate-dependent aminotransferase family protein [Luteibacter sp. UNCMF331Sha3.1]SEM23898.1 glycine C-acetyltransferase [Luteibacter sp. UNCMF331Sha3.1]